MENKKEYIVYTNNSINHIKRKIQKQQYYIAPINNTFYLKNDICLTVIDTKVFTQCIGRRWDKCWVNKNIPLFQLFQDILPYAKCTGNDLILF